MVTSYIISKITLILDTKIEFTIGNFLKCLIVAYFLFTPFSYIVSCIKNKRIVGVNWKYFLYTWAFSPILMLREFIRMWWEEI